MREDEKSWSDILQNVVSNVQEIVRSEVRLATTEVKEEGQLAAKASVPLGVGAVLGFYALGFILLCIVYALSIVVASWLAALIVGVVVGLIGVLSISAGVKKLKTIHKPERTIQSLEETVQWAKNQSS